MGITLSIIDMPAHLIASKGPGVEVNEKTRIRMALSRKGLRMFEVRLATLIVRLACFSTVNSVDTLK